MDPLSVLRDFNTTNKLNLVQQVQGNVQFGDRYSFPAATPVYKAAIPQAASAYYSLQDVLFYLKNRQLKPQEYVMAANQSGVANINIVDRKKILDVLDGVAPLDPSLVPPLAVGVVTPGAGGRAAPGGAEPQAKRQRLAEDEASAMRGLMEQERQLRNRNSMLVAPNKDFRKVLEVVLGVKKQVAAAAAAAAQSKAAAAGSGSGHKGAAPASGASKQAADGRPPSSRYGRDSTADQLKAMAPGAGGSLAVNMYGTSGAAAAPPSGSGYVPVRKSGSSSAGPAPPPPPPPPPASGGAPAAAGKSGSGAKPHAGGGSSSGKGAPGAAAGAAAGRSAGSGAAKDGAGGKKGGVPIIIVPSGLTSMVNMYNARAFLEEGRFVPAAQAQAAAGGAPKPSSLTFRRTAHRSAPGVEYQLTDKVPPAGSPDWERVVAVVVQGAKWQFKDWPHKGAKEGDLVEALGKVCGFYLHYSDEKVGAPVSDWNVRPVPLHRESRHKDMTALLQLYRHLDVFLQARRSTLAY